MQRNIELIKDQRLAETGFFRSYSMFYLAISRTQYFPIETEEGEVGGTTRERSVSRHVTSTGLVRY